LKPARPEQAEPPLPDLGSSPPPPLPAFDPACEPAAAAAAAAAFLSDLAQALAAPARCAERVGEELAAEQQASAARGRSDLPSDHAERVDLLHSFCVLHYVAAFKLVKKFNRVYGAALQEPLSALPTLLASPLLASPRLHALFAAAARGAGSPRAAAAAAAAAAAPQPPPSPSAEERGGSHGSASTGSDAPVGPSFSAGLAGGRAVCCDSCARPQLRFVVLSCSHSFCWGCVAASFRRPEEPPEAPRPPLPPGAGGLTRRFSAASLESESPRVSPRAPPPPRTLLCPCCDSAEALDEGHLEVNALLSDHAFVWIMAPAEGRRRRRGSGAERSLSAGIDFSVFACSPPTSPAAASLRPSSSWNVGGRWPSASQTHVSI